MKLAFFLEDELLGIGYTDGALSIHYCCEKCGKIWGRELVMDHVSNHAFVMSNCPEHFTHTAFEYYHPPVFSDEIKNPRFWVRKVPREVLKRDFLFLCQEMS